MVEYIQECRDESEIINFFKLRGKILNKDDINKLKANYKYFTTENYNKNQLTLKQLDKIAGGFYLYEEEVLKFDGHKLTETVMLFNGEVPSDIKHMYEKPSYKAMFDNPAYIPFIKEIHEPFDATSHEKTSHAETICVEIEHDGITDIVSYKISYQVNFIPIRLHSIRTLPVEVIQHILNFKIDDLYSSHQKRNLNAMFLSLT